MPENLDELAKAGYMPTEVEPDGGVVRLARLATASFGEVWYSDTASAPGHTRSVSIATFVEQFAERRAGEHLRLIAHVSRCGSTLLANLLALRPTTMVLKEPDFVTVPARMIALAADDAAARAHRDLLTALLNYSCHTAAMAGRTLVVKITSWTVPIVVSCLDGAPDTTWLLQWREPAEMVASNMASPSTWGEDTANRRAARRLAGAGVLPSDVAGFYATTWARIVESVLSAEDLRWRALDYQDLVRDKAFSLLETERWFDIAARALPAGFDVEGDRYSKGQRGQAFEPTGTHRRGGLEPAAAKRVGAITEPVRVRLCKEEGHRLF
jgi:hypothetical protein